jgi:peptide/nickel transport system permease protein
MTSVQVPVPAAVPTRTVAAAPHWKTVAGRVARQVGRIVGRLILVLFGVLTLLFVLLNSAGNPAAAIAGQNASPARVAQVSAQYGFNRPLIDQYGTFLWQSVRFNFGQSYQEHVPATTVVFNLLPVTLELIALAYLLALLVGVPLGLIEGLTRSRTYGGLMAVVVMIGQAIPVFASGTILVYFLSVQLGWLPSLASNGLNSGVAAVIMPVAVLALYPISRILEVTRSGVRESMQEDYIRTAQSKGAGPWRVVSRHAFRPVLTALITVIGVDFAQLLSGGVLVEVIFAWPGLGPELVNAVSTRDYPVIAAATYCFAVIVVLTNLITDLLYRWLDPRLRRR